MVSETSVLCVCVQHTDLPHILLDLHVSVLFLELLYMALKILTSNYLLIIYRKTVDVCILACVPES